MSDPRAVRSVSPLCPRCEQGQVFPAKIAATGELLLICEECEATWDADEVLTAVRSRDLGTRLEERGLSPLFDKLEMPALDGVPAYPTLAAFQAVTLAAGEVRDVTLAVAHDAYRQWSQADGRWITQPGPRRVQVGRFLGDAVWEGTVTPPH